VAGFLFGGKPMPHTMANLRVIGGKIVRERAFVAGVLLLWTGND